MSSRRKKGLVDSNDGWTTITPPSRKNTKSTFPAILRAHQDDKLTSHSHTGQLKESSTSYDRVKNRFDEINTTFQASDCARLLSVLLKDVHQDLQNAQVEMNTCVCLALGSLSEARMRVAPLYQFSVLLEIMKQFDVDAVLLKEHDIHLVADAEELKKYLEKPDETLVYLPHGSLHLSHEYMGVYPRVYLGNSVDTWQLRRRSRTDDLITSVRMGYRLPEKDRTDFPAFTVFDKEYEKAVFPEASKFYDGSVFNELELYWRKEDVLTRKYEERHAEDDKREGDEEGDVDDLEKEVEKLTLERM